MQQLIDCTMLCTHTVRSWAGRWAGALTDGKLRIRIADMVPDAGTADAGATLDAMRTHLQATELCLLPVCPDNLSWIRMLLGQVCGFLPVPVMAVTNDLKAVALRDLLALGVADFIRIPGCHEELRVRVERVLAQVRTAQLDTLSRTLGNTSYPLPEVAEASVYSRYGAQVGVYARCSVDSPDTAVATDATKDPVKRDRAVRTYAMGRLVLRAPHKQAEMSRIPHPPSVQHMAPQRRPGVQTGLELETFAAATAMRCALRSEPFKQAKGRVIEGFEKAYLIAALSRYSGNIAQAARAAKKHRRAFWELVRKHHIDLSQYRAAGQTPFEPDK